MEKSDVFIVGGGPAGLAAAIASKNKGFDVVVADALQPPIDKPCGEGLLPGTVAALTRLGVFLDGFDARPFTGIRFADSEFSIEADFAGTALGVRRTVLHQRLVERAERCGVRLLWNTHVTALGPNYVIAGAARIKARWIVGADGSGSRVRFRTGLDSRRSYVRFGFRQHYNLPAWSRRVEVHWAASEQVYVTPVSDTEVCLVSLSRDPQRRLADVLANFPELQARLSAAEPLSVERGAVTFAQQLPRVYRGNVVLVGDASGGVDAVTGDGIGLCLQHALALANAFEKSDLASYQREHRRLARRPLWMGRLLLAMDGRPWLRSRMFSALASNPGLFRRMLAMHTGSASASQTMSTLATLGKELLAPST
jgi:menaquinone-9 beta-reductase